MAFEFVGTSAVVTGAGSQHGIGFATAKLLCEQGARVMLCGASPRVHERAEELGALGFDAHAWHGDLTQEHSAAALVSQSVSALGGIDILVNNAGMTSATDAAGDSGEVSDAQHLSLEGWHKSLARNLDTAFLVTKHALPFLRSSDRGRVVMVSSVTGPVMAMHSDVAYAAAKAGMAGLARALAVDEARFGVCVNTVAPGWVLTQSQTAAEATEGLLVPLRRSASPEEVAAAVVFLASEEAAYITGQVLVVDGGNSIAEERSV